MQKKLIALAVAGLISAPAMAQSNVTIYGVADAGFSYGKSDDNKFKGIQSGLLSASRIGLKGVEDLGNGLKAKFALEYGIGLDEGSGPTGARQSWVGLEGGFGFIGLGRQYSPGHNYMGMLDNFGGSTAFSSYLDVVTSSIANGGPGRWNNAINYKSPKFSGFDVQAIYAFGESDDQADEFGERDLGTRWGIGAGYKNAGIKAAAVYHSTDMDSDVELDNETIKEWMVGAGYDFGFMDVNLTYTDVSNIDGVDGLDGKTPYLNVGVPVGAGKILLGYAQTKYESDAGDYKIKGYSVAYTHSLSKRTTAYVGYTQVDNDDNTVEGFTTGGGVDAFQDPVTGEFDDVGGFAVGLRHTF